MNDQRMGGDYGLRAEFHTTPIGVVVTFEIYPILIGTSFERMAVPHSGQTPLVLPVRL